MFLRPLVSLASSLLLTTSLTYAETHTMLVLDGSGSMWGQIEGKAKITIARNVVSDILQNWDGQNQLGLTAYGHRRKGDCSDIEQLIPVGKVNTKAFTQVVNSINPKGKTPMSEAVKIAAQSLKYTEEAATVILVSDGKETCHADPCALAAELEKTGVDFTAHVIGFDVNDDQAIKQLSCIAENTGGTFSRASTASELKRALDKAVKKSVSGSNLKVNIYLAEGGKRVGVDWIDVLDAQTGEQVVRTVGGSAVSGAQGFSVAPGEYTIVARDHSVNANTTVSIIEGKQHEVDIVLNAGFVKVNTVAISGGEPLAVDWIGLYRGDKQLKNNLGGSGSTTFLAPAGELIVDARKNPLANSQPLTLVAGETVDIELVLNSGTLVASSRLMSSEEKLGVSWFTAFKLGAEGKEASIMRKLGGSGTTTMQLPVGKYRIQASHGDGGVVSTQVEILPEQTTTTEAVFDYGWVNVSVIKGDKPIGQSWIQASAVNADGATGKRFVRKLGGSGKAAMLLPAGNARITAIPSQQAFSPLNQDVLVSAGKTTPVVIDFPASGTVKVLAKLASSEELLKVDWFSAYRLDEQGGEKKVTNVLGGSGQTTLLLPVGNYRIQATFNNHIQVSNQLEVLDGQTITSEAIFNYGWVHASFVKEGKAIGQSWIDAAEINADGSSGKRLYRQLGGSGKAWLLLPAGKARIMGVPRQRGAAIPTQDVVVEAGKKLEIVVDVP